MASIRRRCLPPFTFVDFAALLMPWLWFLDPFAFLNDLWETTTPVKRSSIDDQTITSLLVMDSDLKHLTPKEAKQIIHQFKNLPQSSDKLLFWTGIPRDWVQQWADQHGMLTLTTAMGPLMDVTNPRCLKLYKRPKKWRRYIKGASAIFARFACGHGVVRVLTLPPSQSEFLRPQSSYRTIEEPVLKGSSGCSAVQINFVHLLVGCREVEYQKWPDDHTSDGLDCKGADEFNFKLPPRVVKALNVMMRPTATTEPKPGIATPHPHGSGQTSSVFPARQTDNAGDNQKLCKAPKGCGTQQGLNQTKFNTEKTTKCGTVKISESDKRPREHARPRNTIIPQSTIPSQESKNSQGKVQPRTKPPQVTKQPQIEKQQVLDSKLTKQNTSLNQKQICNLILSSSGVTKNQSIANASGQIVKMKKKKNK